MGSLLVGVVPFGVVGAVVPLFGAVLGFTRGSFLVAGGVFASLFGMLLVVDLSDFKNSLLPPEPPLLFVEDDEVDDDTGEGRPLEGLLVAGVGLRTPTAAAATLDAAADTRSALVFTATDSLTVKPALSSPLAVGASELPPVRAFFGSSLSPLSDGFGRLGMAAGYRNRYSTCVIFCTYDSSPLALQQVVGGGVGAYWRLEAGLFEVKQSERR